MQIEEKFSILLPQPAFNQLLAHFCSGLWIMPHWKEVPFRQKLSCNRLCTCKYAYKWKVWYKQQTLCISGFNIHASVNCRWETLKGHFVSTPFFSCHYSLNCIVQQWRSRSQCCCKCWSAAVSGLEMIQRMQEAVCRYSNFLQGTWASQMLVSHWTESQSIPQMLRGKRTHRYEVYILGVREK